MTVLDINQVLAHSPSAVYRDLDAEEGGVLLHLDSGGYFSVNTVGRDVWMLLDGQRSLEEVVMAIRQKHPDADEQAGADVLSFATAVVDRGLADVVRPTPHSG